MTDTTPDPTTGSTSPLPTPLPPRALIGMIHVPALPGTPRSAMAPEEIAKRAAEEATLLVEAGFDAIIVENMHDAPYVHGRHGPEIVATMTRCVLGVRAMVDESFPLGVQVLSGGTREALAIAHACLGPADGAGGCGSGAAFIRCENFVFSHIADEGLLERAEAGDLLRYRRAIGAGSVRVFADIKKKHASHAITADIPLDEAARAAAFFGADGLIVTGLATGRPTSPADVASVREACDLPLLVGSGVSPDSARGLFEAGADGLIVGSWIKREGLWSNPPDPDRCRRLIQSVRG